MIGAWLAAAVLTLALLGWLGWLSLELRRIVREAASVPAALQNPETIRTTWSDQPHPLFRFGPARTAVAAVEAAGFRVIGHRTEHAGTARIRAVVLLSEDATIQGSVGVWHLLPAGRIEAFTSFLSEAEDGTLLLTTSQAARVEGLVAQAVPGDGLERLRRHRALIAAHPSPPHTLDPAHAACDARSLAFYQRRRLVEPPAPRPLRGVVDGRQAARDAGLSVKTSPVDGFGVAAFLDALTLAFALGGTLQVWRGQSPLPWLGLWSVAIGARLWWWLRNRPPAGG